MLISNWRIRLLHISLTGMETVWLLPILMLRFPNMQPLAGYLILLGLALFWLLSYDVIDLQKWPAFLRLGSLLTGYAVVTSLWIWLAQYRSTVPFFPLSWVPQAMAMVVNFENGISPQAVIFGLSTWLWLRAAWSARRNLTSLAIEHSLRNGMFLILIEAWWIQRLHMQALPYWLPAIYLAFGISALSLARSDERHAMAHVRGGAPPVRRLAQFLMVVLVIMGTTLLASKVLPSPLTKGLNWLGFVVEIAIILFQLAAVAVLILGAQFTNWLRGFINPGTYDANQMTMPDQNSILDMMQEQLNQQTGQDITLPLWALHVLKYVPIALVILGVLAIFLLINRAVYRRRLRADEEDESEAAFPARNILRNGLNQLRNLAEMSRKFRLGEGLLAAISVEAIYANVCRLAAQLGQPRPKAMPAESYLPVLCDLFEELDAELARITHAYMRVHYGDQQIRAQELLNLQRDYGRLRRAAMKAK